MKNIDYQMWARNGGFILALLWAGFWIWFGLASGFGEGLKPMGILLHTTMPGLFFLSSVIIAWRWEAVGGALLLLEGIVILLAYPLMTYQRFPLATDHRVVNGNVNTNVTARIDGNVVTLQYAGRAPGFVGLNQFNVVLPAGITSGTHTLAFTRSEASSNTTTLAIR